MKSTKQQLGNNNPWGDEQQTKQLMLRIGPNIGVPDVLRGLGADPAKVMAEVGIDHELFDNPNNLISFEARGRLLAHCADRTSCQHFGLLVGQKSGLQSLGLAGLRSKYSSNVSSALDNLVRFLHLNVRGATTSLGIDSGVAVFEYQIYHTRARGNDQVGDGALAVIYNIMRELCGDDWQPIEIRFAHSKPGNMSPFRQFFRAPLCFDTSQYAVVFSSTWLDHRLPDVDTEVLKLLQNEIRKFETRQGENFTDRVRRVLRNVLVSSHSSADHVAELFSMHRSTMNRHLNELGTSFQDLVDEVRFEIARQLLEDTRMEVIQIASILGYSNASAFTRAFRRWSSTTPAEWRKSVRRDMLS